MKLSVEIKDNKFTYTYEVGESKRTGSRHLCSDSLVRFVTLLQTCQNAWQHEDKEWEREVIAKAYLEKQKANPSQGEKC